MFALVDSSIPFGGLIRVNALVFVFFCYSRLSPTTYLCMYDLLDSQKRIIHQGLSADPIMIVSS
jgi:hypothetical protein